MKARWTPSLKVHLALLVFITLIILWVTNTFVSTQIRQKLAESVVVNSLTSTIHTLRAVILEVPPEERNEFIQHVSKDEWWLSTDKLPMGSHYSWAYKDRVEQGRIPIDPKKILNLPNRPHKPPPPSLLADPTRSYIVKEADLIIKLLNKEFNDGTYIALGPNFKNRQPTLYVSLTPEQVPTFGKAEHTWIVMPLTKFSRFSLTNYYYIFGGMTVVLVLLALTFSWYIALPLIRLGRTADRVAKGELAYMKPSGPSETRHLIERFNAMIKSLDESKKVQRTLLGGLPHDLKGPLTRLCLRLEMSEDSPAKEGMLKDIDELKAIIYQFTSYLRGSNLDSYTFEPTNLTQWVDEHVSSWTDAGSPVQLVSLPDHPLWIQADTLSLGRLIDNLVSNSLKHGEPPVEVSLSQDGNQAHLCIGDHGVGIDPDEYETALRAFSRLDYARTKTGSVGLGLALVDLIVTAHKGRLYLDRYTTSEHPENQGLAVHILLPLSQAPLPAS